MKQFDDMKVAIFDLDGTLYQDYSFLERYLTYLLNETVSTQELQEKISEAYAILAGEHPIQLGHFVDKEKKLTFIHDQKMMTKAFTWEGEEIEIASVADASLVDLNSEQLLYIGDPWGIAGFYMERYQLDPKKCIDAFHKVRQEMLVAPFAIDLHQPLFEAIEQMDIEKKVFMTNTPDQSAQEFVEFLGIGNLFHDYVYDAKKPVGIQNYLAKLLQQGYRAEQILSVGDNPWNDLYPVQQIGGRTCLITKYKHLGFIEADVTVESIEQLAQLLSYRPTKISS